MKILLFLGLIVLASATAGKTVEELRELRRECMQSLPEDLKQQLREIKYPKDEKIMKYCHCVADKMGIFNKDGFDPELMSEVYKNKISKEDLRAIADPCLKKYQSKDYSKVKELAYYQWTCMLEDEKFISLFRKNTN